MWFSEFKINRFLFLTTKSISKRIHWDTKGNISKLLNRFLHETVAPNTFSIIIAVPFSLCTKMCISSNAPSKLCQKMLRFTLLALSTDHSSCYPCAVKIYGKSVHPWLTEVLKTTAFVSVILKPIFICTKFCFFLL